jgi:PAS domain S-box-containing protein
MDKLTQILNIIYNQDFNESGVTLQNSVLKDFADIIGKDHFVVSRIEKTGANEAKSVVFYSKGKFLPGITYGLKNSPFKNFTDDGLRIYKENVRKLFPGDEMLAQLNAESYIAAPLIRPDGDLIGIISVMDGLPMTDAEADEISVLLKVISVTILNTIEEQSPLTKSLMLRQRYKKLFDNAPVSILLMDPTSIFECNSYTLKMFECINEDILGKSLLDFSLSSQPDGSLSSEKITEHIDSTLKGDLNTFEWSFQSKRGKEFYTEVTLSKIDIGTKTYVQAILHDITERKKSASLIQYERDFGEMIINLLPGSFFLYDITGGIDNASLVKRNRWFVEKLDYSEEEINEMQLEYFFSDNERVKLKSAMQELLKNKYGEVELNVRHKDGYELPYLFHAYKFEQKNHTYIVGFGFDMSERKHAELALRMGEQRFKNIFNSSSDGILVLDKNLRILNANPPILKMFDYKFEEVVFHNILDYVPEQSLQVLKDRTESMYKNEPLNPIEIMILSRTGKIIPVEINSKIIQYDDEEGIITVVRDISERKVYEKKLFYAEINAEEKERERFAKELHDGLGPILSTCKIYMYSLAEKLEEDKDLLHISNRSLTLIDDSLRTIKEIANNLSPHILRNFGLVQALLSFTHNLESMCDLKFEIHYNFDERLDDNIEFGLYRVLTELINNTLKYAEASLVKIDLNLKGPRLKVSYADNGKGFDLKEVTNQKKGFGLINIENRISKLNGTFLYNTSPGEGINVKIDLNSNYFYK